jgi:hypothetical protein
MYTHLILMSISKKLSRFDLKIHEVSHKKCLTVDEDIISH